MKKLAIKTISFLLIFCVLFLTVQEVIRYNVEYRENMKYRYEEFLKEPENSLDVLFIGSSPVYAGIAPTVIWKDAGITSVNLATSDATAMSGYYQLRFALQSQKPALVVIDFNSICRDRLADESDSMEASYRKNVAALPDRKLKNEMILQIEKDNVNQSRWMYYFPLLRDHSRWSELELKDLISLVSLFTDRFNYYKEYTKGAFYEVEISEDLIECNEELFEADIKPTPVSEYSWGYYKKIIDLCAENGIALAVVSLPKGNTEELIGEYKALEKVCSENNIRYYNLSSPESWDALSLDGATDFYNTGHVNANGATKVSKALAKILQEDFDLPDHRGDSAYSAWDDDWDAFYADYKEVLAPFGY